VLRDHPRENEEKHAQSNQRHGHGKRDRRNESKDEDEGGSCDGADGNRCTLRRSSIDPYGRWSPTFGELSRPARSLLRVGNSPRGRPLLARVKLPGALSGIRP
jgi:hypothetical protein